MKAATLIKTGVASAVVAAVCCATPILVVALGAVGLSALTGYLDYVLLLVLALCLALVGYGLYRHRQNAAGYPTSANGITKGTRHE